MNNKIFHSEMLRLWGIQDALLQQYRGMFLSSQSILMSFVATLAIASSKYDIAVFAVLFLFLISAYLLRIWLTVTTQRAEGVSFCQNELLEMEKKDCHTNKPVGRLIEHMSQHSELIEWKHLIFSSLQIFGHEQTTRKHLQLLPTLFFWLWVFVLFFSVIQSIS